MLPRRASREESVTQVTIAAGWWRATPHSDTLYRCEYSGACEEGRCTEGHKGPACRVCKKGYAYDALENNCSECGDRVRDTILVLAGVALFVVLVLAALARRFPHLFEEAAKDAARGTVEQDADEEEDVAHKWFHSAKSKSKILLGVYQAVRNSARRGRFGSGGGR